jgi:hypothetical protein
MVSLSSVRRLKPDEVRIMLQDENGMRSFDFSEEAALVFSANLLRAFPAFSRNDLDDLISRLPFEQSPVT